MQPLDSSPSCAALQGKGHGAIHLELTYWPFDMIYSQPREATIVSPPPWQIVSLIKPVCASWPEAEVF